MCCLTKFKYLLQDNLANDKQARQNKQPFWPILAALVMNCYGFKNYFKLFLYFKKFSFQSLPV